MAQAARSKRLSFIKMHGLGNDFAVFDARDGIFALDPDVVQAIAARRTGIGFDQLITLLPSARADVFMAIQNADGSEAGACGNATRCVADLIMEETGKDTVTIETRGGHASARAVRHAGRRAIRVDMGPPQLEWRQIPLAHEVDTLHLNLTSGRLSDPVAVGIGNPHVVFFVNDLRVVDITKAGPRFETDPLFPNGVNVSVAQVPRVNLIRLKVWERGVGVSEACGTAACAALVAAVRRGLVQRKAVVEMPGGRLDIAWSEDNHVLMTGPVATSFKGFIDVSAFGKHAADDYLDDAVIDDEDA